MYSIIMYMYTYIQYNYFLLNCIVIWYGNILDCMYIYINTYTPTLYCICC